jgi:hypothetical protein
MALSEEAERESSSSYDPVQHIAIEASAAGCVFWPAIYHVRHNYKTLLFGQLLSAEFVVGQHDECCSSHATFELRS